MNRLLLITLAIVLSSSCSLQDGRSSSSSRERMESNSFEGAYELVSETITLTKPEQRTVQIAPPEWLGIWLFQSGRFSITLMKQRRSWFPFPRSPQDLGYISSAGTYNINGAHLLLKHELSLNPVGIGHPTDVEYHLEGDTLTLIETINPRMEDLSEGQQVTVLRKIKNLLRP